MFMHFVWRRPIAFMISQRYSHLKIALIYSISPTNTWSLFSSTPEWLSGLCLTTSTNQVFSTYLTGCLIVLLDTKWIFFSGGPFLTEPRFGFFRYSFLVQILYFGSTEKILEMFKIWKYLPCHLGLIFCNISILTSEWHYLT